MPETLTVLGLESSCDDTAAAVVDVQGGDGPGRIRSSVVVDQTALHAAFGGVVPELAARAHAEKIDFAVEEALARAKVRLGEIDLIAVTAGPGLIGGVLAGVMCAKGLSAGSGIPLVGLNHLAGHALTPRLSDGLATPYVMLLVSGGHCQLLLVLGPDHHRRLGGTIDDAPGEAFDKTAKLLGLSQPGGPIVEASAEQGDPNRFALPRPLLDRPGCDMSFSGLKTAVLRQRDSLIADGSGLHAKDRADLCAAFQTSVADILTEKTRRALALVSDVPLQGLAVAGGVAANTLLRARLQGLAEEAGLAYVAPPLKLCTDNAAMIAWAGAELYGAGYRDGLELGARARWPLDQTSPSLLGSGKKGPKA
ncbi:MAG: tRNA (adenosine(37)-N6)-threonylcarbamoyltransferase complex transferase subunit TsaD [Pseudomonadota bacterium]